MPKWVSLFCLKAQAKLMKPKHGTQPKLTQNMKHNIVYSRAPITRDFYFKKCEQLSYCTLCVLN